MASVKPVKRIACTPEILARILDSHEHATIHDGDNTWHIETISWKRYDLELRVTLNDDNANSVYVSYNWDGGIRSQYPDNELPSIIGEAIASL